MLAIEGDALSGASLKYFIVPKTVIELEKNSFKGVSAVIVYKDSYAEKFCKENNIEFYYVEQLEEIKLKFYTLEDAWGIEDRSQIPSGVEIVDVHYTEDSEWWYNNSEINEQLGIVFPDTVKEIRRFDLNFKKSHSITIPSSVEKIGFISHLESCTLFVEKGSYAESWAKEHGCKYF